MIKDNFLSGVNFGCGLMVLAIFIGLISMGKFQPLFLIMSFFNFYMSYTLKE